jgi:hypothetical protein
MRKKLGMTINKVESHNDFINISINIMYDKHKKKIYVEEYTKKDKRKTR